MWLVLEAVITSVWIVRQGGTVMVSSIPACSVLTTHGPMQVKETVLVLGTALLDFLATLALGFRSKWTRWRGREGERYEAVYEYLEEPHTKRWRERVSGHFLLFIWQQRRFSFDFNF
jgi:hypothetical protein